MNRVIKFPLIMNDGNEVRTIDELREKFNLEKVTEYYIEGKLKTWLKHRNYIEELSQLEKLDCCDDRNKIPFMLCKIFDVEQVINLSISEIEQKKSRLSILKSFSDDEKWEEKLEFIAFTQEELENKLLLGNLNNIFDGKMKAQRREVYLCGEIFNVNDKFKNITYIGVNTPFVNIISNKIFDAKVNDIKFKNVKITSDVIIQAVFIDNDKCTIDDGKISLLKMWSESPTIIYGKRFDKVLVYKNKVIGYGDSLFEKEFEIIDIYSGTVLMNMSDLETFLLKNKIFESHSLKLKIEVCAMTIYKCKLVCFCVDKSYRYDSREVIIYINLETLNLEKLFESPKGNNYISMPDNMVIYNNRISLYKGSKWQYHDFNAGKYIGNSMEASKQVGQARFGPVFYLNEDGIGNIQFYKGNKYEFIPRSYKMITDNEEYSFKGFKKVEIQKGVCSSNKMGKIGAFEMFSGKIVATGCYVANKHGVRLANDSVLNEDGYIAMYNITGGDAIKALKVSNSIIRVIKYYKGVLVIISEDREVIVLDAETFNILNSFKLPRNPNEEDELDDIMERHAEQLRNAFGNLSRDVDIYIDDNSDKMIISYDKIFYLYE